MHFRYKFRNPKGLITPKGPSFSSSRTISCDIDGTIIKFKTPKHRPRHSNHEQHLPKSSYHTEDMIFRSVLDESTNTSKDWKSFKFFYNSWAFYGPWFTGTQAELRMYFDLVKPTNYKNKNFSLFHPRALENIIGDYLTSNFSNYTSEYHNGKHHYITPVNWTPLNHLPVIAVRLQVVPDEAVTHDTTQELFFFPISDKVMACIQFSPSRILNLTNAELDKKVNPSTMHELMNNIINSFQLTLSAETEAQQKKALEGLEDTSLVKDYPPLRWGKQASTSAQQVIEEI